MQKFMTHQLVEVVDEAKELYSVPVDGLLEIVHIRYQGELCVEMLVRRVNEDHTLREPHGIFEVLPKSVQLI